LHLREAEAAGARATLAAAHTNLERPTHLTAALAEAEALLARTETERSNLPFQLRAAEARHLQAVRELESQSAASSAVSVLAVQRARAERDAAAATAEELKAREPRLVKEIEALTRRRDALRQRLELKVDETRALAEAEAAARAAEARLEQARVALKTAKVRLERMTVCAPRAGRVLSLVARPGMRLMGLAPGSLHDSSTVVTLYDPHCLQVRADVRLEDVPRVRPGQSVRIETPAVPGGPLDGEVLFLTSQADIQKNTLQVKVGIKAPPPTLKADVLVQVTFLAPITSTTGEENPPLRLLAPRSLIEAGPDGAATWIADQAAGVARRRAVRLGGTDGDLVEVIEGLTLTDKLIASGRDGLHDGQRIAVTGEEAGPESASGTGRPTRLPRGAERPGKH
jgi:RND family efflux transporter MFP subunit